MNGAFVYALHVLVLDRVLREQVVDDAAEERDVGARAGSATNWSATAAVRVNRGSTTMSFALLCAFASITHLKPQGCASAGFPPITMTTLAFLMSTQ